jgi:hypothetical protein
MRRCSALHLQIHQLGRRHHIGVQICHDPKRSSDHKGYDEHAKGQRQHVIGVVSSGSDVQEEDQVNANLRDGQDGKSERYAGSP